MVGCEAFAAVPRERFLGPGRWRWLPDRFPGAAFITPDDDPAWLYHDALVTIDTERALNNGLPSLWARSFDHLDWRRQKRVLRSAPGLAITLPDSPRSSGRAVG